MTYRKPGRNAEREAAMRKPPGPPLAWEYGLPVAEIPWGVRPMGDVPPMPEWYQLMHFEAAAGRQALQRARENS